MRYLFVLTLIACDVRLKIEPSSQPSKKTCFHPYGMSNVECRTMEAVREGSYNGAPFTYRLKDCTAPYGVIYSPANVVESACD